MVAVIVSAPILIILGMAINKTSWIPVVKKRAFIGLGTFLAFPVMIPAGTLAVLPMPNWLAIGFILWFEPLELLGFPMWYLKIWHIHLPSFAGMGCLMAFISAIAFFPRLHPRVQK